MLVSKQQWCTGSVSVAAISISEIFEFIPTTEGQRAALKASGWKVCPFPFGVAPSCCSSNPTARMNVSQRGFCDTKKCISLCCNFRFNFLSSQQLGLGAPKCPVVSHLHYQSTDLSWGHLFGSFVPSTSWCERVKIMWPVVFSLK